jgi:hypothetical protein
MSRIGVLRKTILATGALLLAVACWFAATLVPTDHASSKDAVRFRNSLIVSVAAPADFEWTPDRVPPDFRWETSESPGAIRDAVRVALKDQPAGASDFDKVLAIVRHLQAGHVDGRPISNATETAYRSIVERKMGWCSDFSQVLNGVALAAGIGVREWGMAFDGFGGEGHAFNEIYDRRRGKWIFVDAFSAIHVRDRASGAPLSVLEFRAALLSGKAAETVEVVNVTANPGFKYPAKALEYYGRGADQMYLWWANDVFSYDRHPLVALLRALPASVGQTAAILAGAFPEMRIVQSATNAVWIEELEGKRRMLFLMVTAAAVLAAAFAAQLYYFRRARRLGRPARAVAAV